MGAISALCPQALLLVDGRLQFQGDTEAATGQYLSTLTEAQNLVFPPNPMRPSITAIRIDTEALKRRSLVVAVEFCSPWPIAVPVGGLVLRALTGEPLWGSSGRFHLRAREDANGLTNGVLTCCADDLPLIAGKYVVSIWLSDIQENFDAKIDAAVLTLEDHEASIRDSFRAPTSVQGHMHWPAIWTSDPI
jgi:lipopolysaccharide transport system ATP-binding protein